MTINRTSLSPPFIDTIQSQAIDVRARFVKIDFSVLSKSVDKILLLQKDARFKTVRNLYPVDLYIK